MGGTWEGPPEAVWDEAARDDYICWQQQDRKVVKRISTLIDDIQRNGKR